MGQYHRASNLDKQVNVKLSWIKLMEHSWFKNKWVNYVMTQLKHNWFWDRIIWVWDYYEDEEAQKEFWLDGNPYDYFDNIMAFNWDESTDTYNHKPDITDITDIRYLLNLDKKIYIDLVNYEKENDKDWWCIHPLPILTTVSNWRWWWDYHPTEDSDESSIWSWAWDKLGVSTLTPEWFTEEKYIFKE